MKYGIFVLFIIGIYCSTYCQCINPTHVFTRTSCYGAYFESGDEYHQCPGNDPGVPGPGGYVLTFNEEFNEPGGINTSVWQTLFYGNCHALAGNMTTDANGPSEFEYYTPDNLTLNDGILSIPSPQSRPFCAAVGGLCGYEVLPCQTLHTKLHFHLRPSINLFL